MADNLQAPRFITQPSASGSIVAVGRTKILQCQALGKSPITRKSFKTCISCSVFIMHQIFTHWKRRNHNFSLSRFPPAPVSLAKRRRLHIRLFLGALLQNTVGDPPRCGKLSVHCKKQCWQHYQRNDSAFSCIHDLFPGKWRGHRQGQNGPCCSVYLPKHLK